MKKYLAELVGTFILVLFGCGTAVVAGDKVGVVGIAFAFGFALIGAAYGIGPISGCHINPAVSLGVWAAGRMKTERHDRLLGGPVRRGNPGGGGAVRLIAGGMGGGYNIGASGLGQNGWGAGIPGRLQHDFGDHFRVCGHADLRGRDSGLHAESGAGGICGPGHRHHAGGDSHLRHPHHRRECESGAQPWAGLAGGRKGAGARSGCSCWFPVWPESWRDCCSG